MSEYEPEVGTRETNESAIEPLSENARLLAGMWQGRVTK
jgi:hypothetical protein